MPPTSQDYAKNLVGDCRWGAGFCSAVIWVLVFTGACAASQAEVKEADASGYRAKFAVVYSAALAAVRERYPRLREDPVAGVIKTAWHPVSLQSTRSANNINQPASGQSSFANQVGSGVDPLGRQFFVRVTVRVVGGDPWRVTVAAEASAVRGGDVPTPLRGADVPPWLVGRRDALRVDIHDRLSQYAERIAVRKKKQVLPEAGSSKMFAHLPKGVALLIARVHRAARARDVAALRSAMTDDFVWSPDEEPNADVALVVWQADSSVLDSLALTLEDCQSVTHHGGTVEEVRCAATTDEVRHNARFAKMAGTWRFARFYVGR